MGAVNQLLLALLQVALPAASWCLSTPGPSTPAAGLLAAATSVATAASKQWQGSAQEATGNVVLSEMMARNELALTAKVGSVDSGEGQLLQPDWVELANLGDEVVDLGAGWSISVLTPDGGASNNETAAEEEDGQSVRQRSWVFPQGTALPAGGHLLVWAMGKKAAAANSTADEERPSRITSARAVWLPKEPGSGELQPRLATEVPQVVSDLKIPASCCAAVALQRPDGSVASMLRPLLPRQFPDVSFGLPAEDRWVKSAGLPAGQPTYLATPTPGGPNSGPLKHGPFMLGVAAAGEARAGQDIPILAAVYRNLNPVADVYLHYMVNLVDGGDEGDERVVSMQRLAPADLTAAGVRAFGSAAQPLADGARLQQQLAALAEAGADVELWAAAVPKKAFRPGDLVRWRARARDDAGYESVIPLPNSSPSAFRAPRAAEAAEPPGKVEERLRKGEGPQPIVYEGAVVPDPAATALSEPPAAALPAVADAAAGNNGTVAAAAAVPTLYWYSPNVAKSISSDGDGGASVLHFNGSLYHGVEVKRRGVTALSWRKPKLSMKMAQGQGFVYDPDAPPVSKVKLQSFFFELGERSYMKEPLACSLMAAAGVVAPRSSHVQVRLNGAFWGLFAFVEDIDESFLARNGLPTLGPLFKSESGELSNLRWDLPLSEMAFYFDKVNHPQRSADWQLLADFTRGLAGGGPVPRSRYVFDALNLPQAINEMAAQTLLNNMDRCTKNFFVYRHPDTGEWWRLPWDLDGAFGQDNMLGGQPGSNYCVLACEQWNSPLYCDSEDLVKMTPYGPVTATKESFNKRGRRRHGSRLLLQRALSAQQRDQQQLAASETYPTPRGWDDPDRDESGSTSISGAPGTYSHFTDALLDVAATREMYLRRLRTLADEYLAGGGLKTMMDVMYPRIKRLAEEDDKLWQLGISIDRGYAQIATEFLPQREEQLLGEPYGPRGSRPLLPEAQPADVNLTVGAAEQLGLREGFIQLVNNNSFAVDVAGWKLLHAPSGMRLFTFTPGTVIPSRASVYVSPDVAAFRKRSASPRGGEGLLVVGPLQQTDGSARVQAGDVTIVTADGRQIQRQAEQEVISTSNEVAGAAADSSPSKQAAVAGGTDVVAAATSNDASDAAAGSAD